MIVKVFGFIDVTIGIFLIISGLIKQFPSEILWIMGLILILKGTFFISSLNIVSIFDIIIGTVIILSIYTSFSFLFLLILSLYLIQKGIFSFV